MAQRAGAAQGLGWRRREFFRHAAIVARSVPAAAGVVRVAGLIAHPVRELGKRYVEIPPGASVGNRLLERGAHAEQPCIALRITDGESHMPLAQTWMAFFRGIEFWAAGPF